MVHREINTAEEFRDRVIKQVLSDYLTEGIAYAIIERVNLKISQELDDKNLNTYMGYIYNICENNLSKSQSPFIITDLESFYREYKLRKNLTIETRSEEYPTVRKTSIIIKHLEDTFNK